MATKVNTTVNVVIQETNLDQVDDVHGKRDGETEAP